MIASCVDHSRGRAVEVAVAFEKGGITVTTVQDDGIGVFRRVCEDFGYATPADAIVQLEKGKLTSDPARHSGEGLFFSSKAVTRFRLESQGIAWVVDNEVHDSAIAPATRGAERGCGSRRCPASCRDSRTSSRPTPIPRPRRRGGGRSVQRSRTRSTTMVALSVPPAARARFRSSLPACSGDGISPSTCAMVVAGTSPDTPSLDSM